MAPHSSTLAWKIPWMEAPGGLQSMGLLRVGHDWANSLSLFTFRHWRRKWQPTLVFLPGESQGRWSLEGCRLWGCTGSDTTEATSQQQPCVYWRRQWHPTPVLLPGKSHGWRSLEGCSPWGRWGLDMTEQLHFHFHALEKEMAIHSSSCLENARDRGAWWAAVYGVTQSRTRLKRLSSSSVYIVNPNLPNLSLLPLSPGYHSLFSTSLTLLLFL